MANETALLAVLIDADNISAKHGKAIFDEIARFGEASIRRIYGDFSGGTTQGWTREKLASLALVPHQQFANSKGKNSSDIALVIDAMDILHSGRFDGFVIISSDGDFTRLASRIREQGLDVYGIGEKKTPEPFRMACKRFIFVENIAEDVDSTAQARSPKVKGNLQDAQSIIRKAMAAMGQEDEWYDLGQLGKVINSTTPDFDTRTYGQKKLFDLLSSLKLFELRRDGNNQPQVRRLD